MKFDLSGHHIDITDGMRQAVENKFQKVSNHFPDIESLTVILNVERNEQTVDAKTQYLGATVNVKASNQDLYAATADAAKKLEAALRHRKGAANSGHHEKFSMPDQQAD